VKVFIPSNHLLTRNQSMALPSGIASPRICMTHNRGCWGRDSNQW